eukprot:403354489
MSAMKNYSGSSKKITLKSSVCSSDESFIPQENSSNILNHQRSNSKSSFQEKIRKISNFKSKIQIMDSGLNLDERQDHKTLKAKAKNQRKKSSTIFQKFTKPIQKQERKQSLELENSLDQTQNTQYLSFSETENEEGVVIDQASSNKIKKIKFEDQRLNLIKKCQFLKKHQTEEKEIQNSMQVKKLPFIDSIVGKNKSVSPSPITQSKINKFYTSINLAQQQKQSAIKFQTSLDKSQGQQGAQTHEKIQQSNSQNDQMQLTFELSQMEQSHSNQISQLSPSISKNQKHNSPSLKNIIDQNGENSITNT